MNGRWGFMMVYDGFFSFGLRLHYLPTISPATLVLPGADPQGEASVGMDVGFLQRDPHGFPHKRCG